MVIGGGPVNMGKKTKLRLGGAPIYSLHCRAEIVRLRINMRETLFQVILG